MRTSSGTFQAENYINELQKKHRRMTKKSSFFSECTVKILFESN
uniref:Uncharacterized protein n=1 Tax=viral metagenome TaxID=1070528 RepID=A0A6C0HJ98_9ZZZZ